jgi:3D (Asp-Asp-Asp) domain-containing protein
MRQFEVARHYGRLTVVHVTTAEGNRIAITTMGLRGGNKCDFWLDREEAIELASYLVDSFSGANT